MLRVSMNLRGAANLLLCAALAGGCSSSDSGDEGGTKLPNLISFSPMYSAFDGMHEFAVTPSVPSAKEGMGNADPIVASSLKWKVDEAFVKRDEFPELAASVKLTTKKAGKTTVSVTAKTMSGQTVRGESNLTIDSGNQTEWDAGEARYNNGMMIPWMRPAMAQDGMGTCGLPVTIELPKMSACGNCHNSNSMMGITVEHTPTQTAGYSKEDLVNIFTMGAKPAGYSFNSPFLKAAPMPDCIYKAFHTWEMTDDEKKGIVWKLRSITPKVQADIDFARLAAQARMMMMQGGGAAGSGM